MLFLGNQISISSSDEGLGVPRWVTADDGLVVIPAVVMAVLKKSTHVRGVCGLFSSSSSKTLGAV
ncbi:hypothetical protein DPMN_088679 [Dreissena polymorpha]|uniref:Uncharacterized protein n=1 Tax=Dreissena polymorpha TaxID=45954 RepID=A0A9D4KVF1_DREPO|nr:hypothetical protein DPMN_088679 [Dreissena polymorpha]